MEGSLDVLQSRRKSVWKWVWEILFFSYTKNSVLDFNVVCSRSQYQKFFLNNLRVLSSLISMTLFIQFFITEIPLAWFRLKIITNDMPEPILEPKNEIGWFFSFSRFQIHENRKTPTTDHNRFLVAEKSNLHPKKWKSVSRKTSSY